MKTVQRQELTKKQIKKMFRSGFAPSSMEMMHRKAARKEYSSSWPSKYR